jgi:RNA polymerase sigma factor (sigma-70 family)
VTRFEHDPQSGALYVRLRAGEIEETIDLAEPGFGAHLDVDCEGNVLGVEFLSFEEYAELVARSGGTLEIPDSVEREEAPRPKRLALDDRDRERLVTAVSSLSPRQQTIARLYFYDGLKLAEIARELGISKTAVSSQLRGALTALKKELAADDESIAQRYVEEQLEKYFAGAR